ncbi:MAG: nucleoside triphosphate pyrophosphohydrolase [Kiritimatiellaeota bacterium]|nr:nucleoside triphosphate pyrophosphohydrolase [Kiritimatiellota bacterium]
MDNAPGIARLLDVMRRLRAPDGCAWDRAQTLPDLKPCLLEEAYELLEAMASDDIPHHVEELGDVLLQVVFQCQIREEEGRFNFDTVAAALAEKLIRRHPHVFAGADAATPDAVLRQWERLKKEEKDGARSALAGVPKSLPALLRAQRVQGKAKNSGFDWPDRSGPDKKIDEELRELREAVAKDDKAAVEHEVGDVLFSIVNLCRFLGVDAEAALQSANARFSRRFGHVERSAQRDGKNMRDCPLEELDAYWEEAKKQDN